MFCMGSFYALGRSCREQRWAKQLPAFLALALHSLAMFLAGHQPWRCLCFCCRNLHRLKPIFLPSSLAMHSAMVLPSCRSPIGEPPPAAFPIAIAGCESAAAPAGPPPCRTYRRIVITAELPVILCRCHHVQLMEAIALANT